MTPILKLLTAGAVLVSGAGIAAVAFAQQGPGFGPGHLGMGPGMMMGNFGDPAERLSDVKAELGIKPEQTAAWDAYAKVVTETATAMRAQRDHIDPGALAEMDVTDREAHFATMRQQAQDAQAKVKAAAETLLSKLDDTQRAKASQSLPGLIAAGPAPYMPFGMMGGPGMGSPRMR